MSQYVQYFDLNIKIVLEYGRQVPKLGKNCAVQAVNKKLQYN